MLCINSPFYNSLVTTVHFTYAFAEHTIADFYRSGGAKALYRAHIDGLTSRK